MTAMGSTTVQATCAMTPLTPMCETRKNMALLGGLPGPPRPIVTRGMSTLLRTPCTKRVQVAAWFEPVENVTTHGLPASENDKKKA